MNYYSEIKNKLIDNEIYQRVKDYSKERNKLEAYYEVGKLLSEAGKHYGEKIVEKYSKKLRKEVGKKYNITILKRMRQFYQLIEKGATLSHQLTWSHYVELITYSNLNEIKYYIKIVEEQNLSIRQLRERIKSHEYERLPVETKNKKINKDNNIIVDYIKNPIIIKNNNNYKVISERILHKIILENIESFMKELGDFFCFIASEYKIKISDYYNYIDLLLFNIKYNCYVVVELKITKLQKEHIGQIQVYMNYIDKRLKTIYQDKTIGIIICKKDNKYVIEYCSDSRIISREYKII